MEYALIVACTPSGGIGKNNKIPWYIKEDLRYFQKITLTTSDPMRVNALIMGRNTWESLPQSKPLAGRINVVVSSTLTQDDIIGALVVRSLEQAHSKLRDFPYIGTIFVIGGSRLYREAMFDHHYTKVYLTNIHKEFECDAFIDLKLLDQRYKKVRQGKIITSDTSDLIKYTQDQYEQYDN